MILLPRVEDNFNDKQTTTMARLSVGTRIPFIYGFRRVDSNTLAHILQIVYKALQIIIIVTRILSHYILL